MKCIVCSENKDEGEFRKRRFGKRGQPCKSCYAEYNQRLRMDKRRAKGEKVYDCAACDIPHQNHNFPKLCRKCQAKDAKIPLKSECK